MDIGERATKIAEQREVARRAGDSDKVVKLTKDLDKVYAEKRQRVAQADRNSNDVIVRRARIETELERLMSESRK